MIRKPFALIIGGVMAATAMVSSAAWAEDEKSHQWPIELTRRANNAPDITIKVTLDVGLEKATEADVREAVENATSGLRDDLQQDDIENLVSLTIDQVRDALRKPRHYDHEEWSFSGPMGTFDRAALQRGYQVYREVCASCHSMDFIAFRNLGDPGGLEFSEEEVASLAAEFTIEDGPDDFGDMFDRPGKPSDYFPSPYRNDNEGRAANAGALPPDLSVMTKARHGGADYLYALIIGYDEPVPPLLEMQEGLSYNPYFSGRQIAMAPQLIEGIVEYSDGSSPSPEQMAADVSQFLHWAAEPKMEQRKAMAVPVLIYLLFLTVLLYMSYKRLWRNVDHH